MSDRTVWRLEDEIDQLRDEVTRLRLTDAEREAIAIVESWLPPGMAEIRATLCGLLERLK